MKKYFSYSFLVLLFVLICGITYSQSGLVAYYPFNGNVKDSTKNAYNGTISNISLTTDRYGRSNSACLFNGVNSYITLPVAFDYPERTISLWFKAASIGTENYVLYLSSSPSLTYGHTEMEVRQNSRVSFAVGDQGSFASNTFLNQWYNVVLVVTASDYKGYLNGNLVTMGSKNNSTTVDGFSGVTLGTNRFLTGCFFDGVIDDVKIFNYPLSDQQVANIYNGLASIDDDKETKLSIYPNFTSDKLFIKNPKNVQIEKIYVRNIVGQDIMTINYNSSVDVSTLSEGYYLLLLTDKDNNILKSLRFCKIN